MHRGKFSCLMMASAIVLWAGATAQVEADAGAAATDVADYLSRLERLGFAGSVVIIEGGEPLLARGYGLANRATGSAWTAATVSTLGSITKQFTGAAILALAEEGRVSVEDRITKYFLSVPEDKQSITLHHLLTHSSGIVDLDGLGDWDAVQREEFVQLAMAQELAFEPGEGYEYSNAGFSLLGAIIERVTGGSYESYVRERLLLPARMYETGYVLPEWGDGRLAQGYSGDELWGTVLGRPMADDGPFWVLRGNGGIHSTVWDMARWAQALLAGEVLSPSSMELYWAPHVDEGGGDSFYGYGWVVMEAAGSKVITHNGGNGIFFADMAILPDAELAVVLMTNVVAEFAMSGGLLEQIGYRLLGESLPEVPDVAEAQPRSLERLEGTYTLEGGGVLQATAIDGRLDVEADDPRAFSALLSTRPVDDERAQRLSRRLEEIASAYLAGDYGPLWEAFGRPGSREALSERWARRFERLEERFGDLRTYAVLGTAFREGRDVTLLRLDFENGETYRAYVWDPEAEEALLGVSQRGLDHVLHVYPVAGGGFASWDARTGASVAVDFDTSASAVRLTVADGPRLAAVKAE